MESAVRISRNSAVSLGVFVALLMTVQSASATRIEAVKGKNYKITKQHGPWMIMVASFREPTDGRSEDGLTPEEAAQELVHELRQKGIPAYTVSQSEVIEKTETIDRSGRPRKRAYVAQQDGICVVAGNYKSMDDKLAQQTLKFIKGMHPQFLQQEQATNNVLVKLKNGGIYRKSPGRPGPLAGAFLTVNPLLSQEEVAKRRRDPLILKLNSGGEHSLLDNPGKYTVIVASFYGKSVTQVVGGGFEKAAERFEVSSSLDEAGENAWALVRALRSLNAINPSQPNYEAYVYHDRYRSVVTVGSFDSPHDPRIRQLQETFGSKIKENPQTGKQFMTAEMLTIPPNGPPVKTWLFDPKPEVMEVPKIR
jgi:hypothetical protein